MKKRGVSLKRLQQSERHIAGFQNQKIGRQLNIIYLVAIFIPILALGTFLMINTYSLLFNHHKDLLHTSNAGSKKILNEICNQVYNISDSIVYDQRTIEVLGGEYETELEFRDAVRNYTLIDSFIANYGQIGSITIYTTTPNAASFKNFKPVTEEVAGTQWYRKAIGQRSPFYQLVAEPNSYDNMEYSLALIRKITVLGSSSEAVMVIKVSENYLDSRFSDSGYVTMISFDDQEIFYGTRRVGYGAKMPFGIDYDAEYFSSEFMEEFEGVKCLGAISSCSLKQSDARIYIATLDKNAFRGIVRTMLLSLSIALVALIFPAVLMRVFTRFFVGQVNTLRDEMHKASKEEYDIQKKFSGSFELQEAYSDLLVMVKTIEKQKETMYEAMLNEKQLQNEQQEMEFKMLASQINPHFLYNTLETLRMKAFTAGDREVATGIKLLGKMLRYVLVNIGTTYTSLAAELEHIDCYIKLQKIRFEDRVNYRLKVEEGINVDSYMLLPLLLQPIVENTVVHGLEDVDAKGQIDVHIHAREEQLIIDVADNGRGMTPEMLNKVRESIKEDSITKHSSIGMSNIDQRIKLCYGKEYGIRIDSVLGGGTTVTVVLPRYSALPKEAE